MADQFVKDVVAKIIAAMEPDLPWNGWAVPIDVRFAVECLLAAGWDFIPPARLTMAESPDPDPDRDPEASQDELCDLLRFKENRTSEECGGVGTAAGGDASYPSTLPTPLPTDMAPMFKDARESWEETMSTTDHVPGCPAIALWAGGCRCVVDEPGGEPRPLPRSACDCNETPCIHKLDEAASPLRTTEEVIQRAIEQWAVLAFGAEPTEYPTLAHYIAASLKEAS